MRSTLVVGVLALMALGCSDGMEGWTTLDSGVRYHDEEAGEGEPVKVGQTIKVHYTGWLARGGKVFDSSHSRSDAFTFRVGLGQVIEGWDEGVVGMKVGGTRKVFIPSEKGYGARGSGEKIPPFSDLMFEIKLLEIVSKSPDDERPPEPTNLKMEDVKEGEGAEAKLGRRVRVHYTGWLNIGGRKGPKFDSSVDRGKPFDFRLGAGEVIKGWDQGVVGMKVGGKRTLFIPSELGYGAAGAGPKIPPNADLMFEVELLEVL